MSTALIYLAWNKNHSLGAIALLRVGSVWVNTYRASAAQAPFGGVKASGFGRERSHHALDEYLDIKNVMIDLGEEVRDPFALRT